MNLLQHYNDHISLKVFVFESFLWCHLIQLKPESPPFFLVSGEAYWWLSVKSATLRLTGT